MLLQHKGAFQELFESAQDLQTVLCVFFATARGACMSGVRLEDRAILGTELGSGLAGIARYCSRLWRGRLVGQGGIVAEAWENANANARCEHRDSHGSIGGGGVRQGF